MRTDCLTKEFKCICPLCALRKELHTGIVVTSVRKASLSWRGSGALPVGISQMDVLRNCTRAGNPRPQGCHHSTTTGKRHTKKAMENNLQFPLCALWSNRNKSAMYLFFIFFRLEMFFFSDLIRVSSTIQSCFTDFFEVWSPVFSFQACHT